MSETQSNLNGAILQLDARLDEAQQQFEDSIADVVAQSLLINLLSLLRHLENGATIRDVERVLKERIRAIHEDDDQ